MSDPTSPRRRRPILKLFVVLVLLVVVLVVLAPTLLSLGPATGIARSAIAGSVNGDVALRSARVGWLSGQSLDGLSIRDASGANAINVDVTVHNGLLALLLSGGSTIDATVRGDAKGTLEPDGSTGLTRLFESPASSSGGSGGSGQSAPSPGAPSGLPAGLRAVLTVERFDLALEDVGLKHTYALRDLKGKATVDGAAGTAIADFQSATDFLGGQGTLGIKVDAKNLGGTLDLAKVAGQVEVRGENIRVPAGTTTADFSTLTLDVASPALGQSVSLDAAAQGTLDGTTASTLQAKLALDQPVASNGAVSISPSRMKGEVLASNLPTALAQTLIAGTPIILSEDLGPTVDALEIKAPGGGEQPITIHLKAPKAQLAATALVGPQGEIREASMDGSLTASPATVARIAGASIAGPATISVRGRGIAWSNPTDGGEAISTFVGSVGLAPQSPIVWTDPSGIAVAVGPVGGLTLARATPAESFNVEAALAIAFGGRDALPSTPESPNAQVKATVAPNMDRVDNATAEFAAVLEPAFLAAATGRTFTAPLPLQITVRDLDTALPLTGADGLAIDAVAQVLGENGVYVEPLARDVRFGDLVASLHAVDASKEATLAIRGRVDRGQVDLKQVVRSLPKDFSGIDPLALDVRGSLDVTGLDGAAIVAWAPGQRELIDAAGVRDLSIKLTNQPIPGRPGQRVVADLGGEPIRGQVTAGIERTQASIDKLDLEGTIGRNLVASMQGTSGDRIRIAKDVPFTLALAAPTTIVFDQLQSGQLPPGLAARVTVPELIISAAPGLASAIALRTLDATIAVESADQATAKGSFAAAGITSPNDRIEGAIFDLDWRKPAGPSLLHGVAGDIKLAGVSVPWIETLLGQPKGRLSTWTGDTGGMVIGMASNGDGETIHLVPDFPRLAGTLDVIAKGESVRAQASNVAVHVDAATLESLVARPGAPAEASRYDFQGDLIAKLTAATVTVPRGLATEGFSLSGAAIDLALATDPIGLRVLSAGAQGQQFDVPAIVTTLTSKDLGQGIALTAKNRGGTAPAGGVAPSIVVNGMVRNLLDSSGGIDAAQASVDLDAVIKSLPTVFVDLLASTSGTMTRSLGDTIDLTAKAQNASRTAGHLSLDLKTPYTALNAPSITVKDGLAVVTQQAPLTANFALSPGIKEDLLYVINPVFADVELAKSRATFDMPSLAYPLDGDMTRFNGDFALNIGEVAFRNGQPVSVIMGLLRDRQAQGLEGKIEPLVVTVRNGILSYKDFGLRLNRTPTGWKTSMDLQGEIDLTRNPFYANAITTSLPASQVGNFSSDVRRFFESLGGPDSELAKSLSIGITMFGPLYDAQGRFAKLEQKVTLPKVEDMLKDPTKILDQGLKILDGLKKKDR